MSHSRAGPTHRWVLALALGLTGIAVVGCTSDESSTQTREEATADGRKAYAAGDYETAYDELYPIAKAGDPLSEFFIARMYHFGEGRERDVDKAIKWYTRSAEAGAGPAQYNLGRIFDVEAGYQDTKKAIKWYEKAAAAGNANAMHSLGYVYAELGEQRSAFQWKKRAADAGSGKAQFDIALLYERGHGVPESPELAIKYYRLSAQQGIGEAMVNLALMYSEGRGVQRDMRHIYKWFYLASKKGIDRAVSEVYVLERRIDQRELKSARAMAAAWSHEHLAE